MSLSLFCSNQDPIKDRWGVLVSQQQGTQRTTDGKSQAQELGMELATYLLFPFKKKNKLPVTGPQKTTTVNISLCSLPGCISHVNTHSYMQLQSNCLAASREPALLLNMARGGKRAKTWIPQGRQLVWGANDHEKGSQVRGKTKLPWDTVRRAPRFTDTVAVPRVPLVSSSPELTPTQPCWDTERVSVEAGQQQGHPGWVTMRLLTERTRNSLEERHYIFKSC